MTQKPQKMLKNKIKKLHISTIVFAVMFAVLGVLGGALTTYIITKNDVFRINGRTEVTLSVGEKYTESGVTAIAFGKDVSQHVIISGEVDTYTPGRYVLKYTIDNIRFKGYTLYKLIVVEEVA